MNKRKILLKTGLALLLFGCASYAERYEEVVPLSPEATKELGRQFGDSPPKIVFAINNDGKIVAFGPAGVELRETKFPRKVGDLLEPPKVITLTHTSNSPDTTTACWPNKFGQQTCR